MTSGLDTAFGRVLVEHYGSGADCLVFHGGPGFTHAYIVPHLEFLASQRTLLFFDQLGSGASAWRGPLTFADVCRHAASVLKTYAHAGKATVVAHSFGAAVLLGALHHLPDLKIDGVLLCPVPSRAIRFEAMRANLFERMPAGVISRLAAPSAGKLSGGDLEALLPYYVFPGTVIALPGLSFDMDVYRAIYASLSDYDLTAQLSRLADCHVILGAADFITRDLIADILSVTASWTEIAECGHFPFAERPQAFRAHLNRLFQ